jgi:5-formyltetrahydrofolate cyclo-ligase
MSEIVAAKQALRQEILSKRKLKSDVSFTENLLKLVQELKPERVAIFVSFGTEPNTEEFIKSCSIPILIPVTHTDHLSWEEMPNGNETELASGDLLLIPALAVDMEGSRLGRGKGYFDKVLAALPDQVKVYAVTYESEFIESVPTQSHDAKVDGLITEVAIRNLN